MRNSRLAPVVAGLLLLTGCFGKLRPGLRKDSVIVETSVACQAADPRVCRDRALRQAVSGLMGLYVSSASAFGPELDRSILQQAASYVKRSQVVETSRKDSAGVLRLRAEVLHEKLGRDLDGLGLVKPQGVEGAPRILISLREKGAGAGTDVGRASDVLRRTLSARGYAGIDLSDHLNPKGHQSTGSREEALAAGLESKAEVVITGQAAAAEIDDEALREQGYHTFRGRLSAEALLAGGSPVAVLNTEATAADMSSTGAAAKALENAAELAGEKLAEELAARFRERVEISILVRGLKRVEDVAGLLSAMRRVPGVVGAAAGKLSPEEAALRVFVEKLGADELAARLLQYVKGFSLEVRGVEPDAKLIELETLGMEP